MENPNPAKWEEYFSFKIIEVKMPFGHNLFSPVVIFGDSDFIMHSKSRYKSKGPAVAEAKKTIKKAIQKLRNGEITIHNRNFV